MDTGLLALILLGSALGLVLLFSLLYCLLRHNRSAAEQDKAKARERDEYDS
ncbi:hypothetical protein JOB18_024692 [Solea senegalensis]|uniref:Uncharacterized protein n=1 Tax=Solea senegalensis TaxID=28829 RepID=A0AAV6SZJ3_SOLSE|nr:hypothetical protein JOB18_024692 [Solea senegalensis]